MDRHRILRTWAFLSSLFLQRLISSVRWLVHCLSIIHKYIYGAPTVCWNICLNSPPSFLPLCIVYTILQIWNIYSLIYLISTQSLRLVSIFTSSMKSAQNMPVYNNLSHLGCVGASLHWLTRPNPYIFFQPCFSDLKLHLEISHGGRIYTMKLENDTNWGFYSEV